MSVVKTFKVGNSNPIPYYTTIQAITNSNNENLAERLRTLINNIHKKIGLLILEDAPIFTPLNEQWPVLQLGVGNEFNVTVDSVEGLRDTLKLIITLISSENIKSRTTASEMVHIVNSVNQNIAVNGTSENIILTDLGSYSNKTLEEVVKTLENIYNSFIQVDKETLVFESKGGSLTVNVTTIPDDLTWELTLQN